MNSILEGKRQRIRDAQQWAGYRSAAFARSTHTLVVVVDGYEHGLEDPAMGGPRWFTICDDHGRCVGHDTLALAKFHAVAPEEWCGVCRGDEVTDDGEES